MRAMAKSVQQHLLCQPSDCLALAHGRSSGGSKEAEGYTTQKVTMQ